MAERVLATMAPQELWGQRVLVLLPIPGWPALATEVRRWLLPLLLLRQAGARTLVLPVLPGVETPGQVNVALCQVLQAEGVTVVQAVPGLDGPALAAIRASGPGETLILEDLWVYASGRRLAPDLARQLSTMADLAVGDDPRWRDWLQGYLPLVPVRPQAPWGWPSPSLAVLGGGDLAAKVPLLLRLSLLVDRLALGGALAVNVKMALGERLGRSPAVPGSHGILRDWWRATAPSGLAVRLPEDYWLVDPEVSLGTAVALYAPGGRVARAAVPVLEEVPPEWAVGDLGPQSEVRLLGGIRSAASILWSGPLGVNGQTAVTRSMVTTIGRRRQQRAVTVAAGDSTVNLVQEWQAGEAFSYLMPISSDLLIPPEVLRQVA